MIDLTKSTDDELKILAYDTAKARDDSEAKINAVNEIEEAKYLTALNDINEIKVELDKRLK